MSYHNRDKVLSYNAIINFIVLRRGKGKSYTYKHYCISEFLKSGAKFVYMRRYKSELKNSKEEFFNDMAQVFPNHSFKVKGKYFYCDDRICGYALALSVVSQYKSIPFTDVETLLYDEFIPEDLTARYLPNEGRSFAGALSTIFRDRKIKAFLLGNKINSVTPYNIYFNLPPFNSNYFDKKRKILIFSDEDETEKEENKITSDLQLVLNGTDYYGYNFENKALNNENDFIRKKSNNSELKFILMIKGKYVGMYIDNDKGCINFDNKTDTTFPIKYSFDINNLRECHLLYDKSSNYAKMIKRMLYYGKVFYSNIETKILLEEFISVIK